MEDESLINKLKKTKKVSMKSIESSTIPELPHVLSRFFVEVYEDVEQRNSQEVQVGESFVGLYHGHYIEYVPYETEDEVSTPKAIIEAWDMPAMMAKSVRRNISRIKQSTNDTFAIYVVINPSKCTKTPWGYRSPCWQPEVKSNGVWREACDVECENWKDLKESERRVIYCLGVLGDD
jgi:hypothetical protein